MNWCCNAIKARFELRGQDSTFIVASLSETCSDRSFFYYGDVPFRVNEGESWPDAHKAWMKNCQGTGITNLKLITYCAIRYCPWCGVKLADYYGVDGGILRDDDFFKKIKGAA